MSRFGWRDVPRGGGPRLSIGLKIFTATFLVLMLMMAVTALTVWMAASLNSELRVLGNGYIASYAALARANIRSLERALYLRRLYINARDGEYATSSDELRRLADAAAEAGGQEMGDARRFLRAEIANGSGLRDLVALTRVDTLLEVIEDERTKVAQRQSGLMQALATSADPAGLRQLLAGLEQERADYDRRLDAARYELFQAVSAAAAAAQARQERVVTAVVVITGFAALLGLLLAGGFSRGLSRPVRRLLDGTQAVQEGRLDTVVPITSRDEIGLLTGAFNTMVAELKVKAQIKETFGKYIDPRIVQGLIERPELTASGGDRRVMTVLFCDMRGFTALSESLTPSGFITVVNRYLTVMSEPIRQQDGIIDKYIGDAIMAFWGPPFVVAGAQAELACLAALGQLGRITGLNAALPELLGMRQGLPSLGIRVGIATGEVLVGDIGSEITRSYTVMGDTVNLASRLEAANKHYGTSVLVNEETARLAEEAVELREIDAIRVVGQSEAQRVFELLARKDELDATARELRDRYVEGLAAYRARSWDDARDAFEACVRIEPRDRPARVFLQRLAELAANPPGDSWDGVWSLKEK
jgi:class 3 adenylate cyclase